MLALVEGTPLPADRTSVAHQAMASNPALASLLLAMRSDREELSSLTLVRAPQDLGSRVEAALQTQTERELLLGLATQERDAAVDTIPISTFGPRPLPLAARPWFKVTAAAASIAVGVGLGAAFITSFKKPAPSIVHNDPLNPPKIDIGDLDAPSPQPAIAQGTEPSGRATVSTDPSPTLVAAGDADDPAPPSLSVPTALSLAQEGRLLVRVRTRNTDQAVARLDNLAAKRLANIAVQRLTPATYAVASTGLTEAHLRRFVAPDVVIASDRVPDARSTSSQPSPVAPVGILPPRLDPVGFNVSIEATAEALEALRRELSGTAFRAEFIELPVATPPQPIGDAESILWWTSAPSNWGPRVAISVLIEQR